MPIVDVQVVAKGSAVPEGLALRLAEALAPVLSAPPGHAWVRLSILPEAQYAENGANEGATSLPVFVRLLHADLPNAEVLAMQAEAISRTVALCIPCFPHQVHVEYAPAGRGRVAFGGKLLV